MSERTAVQEREAAPATQVWMLALIGGLAGFCVWWILDQPALLDRRPGAAAIAWCCTFATAFAFTCGQPRMSWSVLFSTSTATAVGLITYWNLAPGPDLWRDDPTWRLLSTALSLIVAVPLFQTVRDAGRWSLPYPELHRYAWTDVVIGAGALLFWLVSAALIVLWGKLFKLIGVNAFADTFAKGWFMAPAFGAIAASGVSLLREWSRIVGTLQRVVMAVLAVLAPVLGFVLLLFLMFLPFTGLAPLWGATKSTTPIILGVVLLALLLVNSVLADRAEDEATSKLLRLGAIVLGMTILPLAVIAATSTWLRVAQYGLTPDRCWAIVFVTFALAYGVGYLASFAHGLSAWPAAVRRGNVLLALSTGGVALLLATPLLDFAALSTRNQVARLLTAQVSVEAFDFAALKFDFGEPGKRALTTLRNISGAPRRSGHPGRSCPRRRVQVLAGTRNSQTSRPTSRAYARGNRSSGDLSARRDAATGTACCARIEQRRLVSRLRAQPKQTLRGSPRRPDKRRASAGCSVHDLVQQLRQQCRQH